MKDLKRKFYIAPYYDDDHWMLVVTDVADHNQVHWFDSLGKSVPSKLRSLINASVRVYGYNGGERMRSQAPQWLQHNCARQQGVVECGYYVMRYMLEIVTRSNPTKAINEVFQDTTPYSQEELDEVRDLWANYFLNI
ncbi:uncharacterized protein LOC141626281 [Silene latifolia]|uniref:uncharacterized protein LOC141626281 n=1 Tax=Silene latifolia TaxID=37657 RepID=UPI003D77EAC9